MKKRILILAVCAAWVLSCAGAWATDGGIVEEIPQESVGEVAAEGDYELVDEPAEEIEKEAVPENEQNQEQTPVQQPEQKPKGTGIVINGNVQDYTAVVHGGRYYLPIRHVFEKIGARVYYRSRDRKILILSRDGDIIYHVAGSNTVTVNGENKIFPNPSISENNTICMPTDMMTAAFRTNLISYKNQQIVITKPIPDTAYGKAVNDALYATSYSNFQPDKFKRYINYHIKNPGMSMPAVVYNVNMETDFPFYENVNVISDPYNPLVLVNKHNRLPAGFAAKNLVNMDRRYTIADGKKYLMEKNAYESFVRMAEAARKEGVSIRAVSTYRTEDYQMRLYNNKLRATGFTNAENYSARPGFSEHQTGLAVDINTTSTSFEYSGVFKWLQKRAHEYGFILRYTKNGKAITGYAYEPWHYRYVGVAVATVIRNEGITYEEYCAKYMSMDGFK